MRRILSKENLNTVIETTLRKKNNNKLFDKVWYQTREEKFLKLNYNGLVVDSIGTVACMAQSQLRSNVASDKGQTKDANGLNIDLDDNAALKAIDKNRRLSHQV